MNTKKCNRCETVYPKTNEFFAFKNKAKGYFSPYCKECERERCKENHKNNYHKYREKRNEASKRWAENNPDRVRANKKKWYKNNKELTKDRAKERTYRLRAESVEFKLHGIVSGQIRTALKGNGKGGSSIKALPYTLTELKEHIESLFVEGMTWENHGSGEGCWNIDHIYPRSLLQYDSLEHPNFQKCWALENLQPLWAIDNLRKSNKLL